MISPEQQKLLSCELEGTPRELLPTQFEDIFAHVRDNDVLAAILGQESEDIQEHIQQLMLTQRVKQLMYARHIMTPEICTAIGDECIMSPGMTLDKICTIAIGDPESDNLRDGGLTVEQAQAITGKCLAHPEMTVDKITLLGFGATPEDIQRIGAEKIATMPLADLSQELF